MILAELLNAGMDLGTAVTGLSIASMCGYLMTKQIPKQQADFQAQILEKDRALSKIVYLLMLMLSVSSPEIRNDPIIKKALEEFAADSGFKGGKI